jgi:hypothetical protein
MAKRKLKNTRTRDTSKNRSRKDKSKSMMRTGSKNGSWKGGKSAHYYRRKAGAKPGEVVHHKNKNKSDNRKSNLKRITKKKHNQVHKRAKKGRSGRKK